MPTKATASTSPLVIEKFNKGKHDRSGFTCGFTPIDNFLKSSLSDQVRDGMATAWIATSKRDPSVIGFYTLGAMAVRADLGPEKWRKAGVPEIPVIYIRVVAVRSDMQGNGIGTALVVNAMERCLSIAESMGAAAIVLDVLEDDHFDRRWKFYAKLGFSPLGDAANPHRVFIPMADVRATFG